MHLPKSEKQWKQSPLQPSIQTDFQAANSYSSIRNLPLKYNNNLNPPAGSQVQCRFCPPTLSESQMLFPMECWQLPGSKLRNDMISCHDCCRIDWLLDFFCKFYEVWKSFEAGSFAVQKKARAVNPTKISSSMCLHMYRACILQCNAINKDMHIIQRSQPLYRPHMTSIGYIDPASRASWSKGAWPKTWVF